MLSDRIALIAVHGVADQKPGGTARALVELLVASPPEDPSATAPNGAAPPQRVRYAAVSEERFEIPVDPLDPHGDSIAPRGDATPRGEDRPAFKAFLQSFRSDLQRADWRAADGAGAAWNERHATRHEDAADRGLATTSYLLTKHIDNGAQREAYETSRIGLEREAGGDRARIDVYEMYWADLSRLSGTVPRIVTELFTMVFRLSKLGRDTVDEALGPVTGVRNADQGGKGRAFLCWLVGWLQRGIDWLFANGLALLFLQLLLLTAMLAGFGLALTIDPILVHRVPCGALAIVGVLWLAYRHRDGKVSTLLGPLAAIVAGAVPLLGWSEAQSWVTAALVLGGVTWLNETGLRVADDRFPFVRSVGRWLWVATLLVVMAGAWHDLDTAVPAPTTLHPNVGPERFALHAWMHGALFATEVVLAVVKVWWEVAGVLLVAWFVVGWMVASGRGYEAKASIATGRLGLAISLGTFLTMTMAGWALLTTALDLSTIRVAYAPCIFPIGAPSTTAPSAPAVAAPASAATSKTPAPLVAAEAQAPSNVCLWMSVDAEKKRGGGGRVAGPSTAKQYLEDRYRASTAAFAALALLLIALVVYLATMFLPSVLAELKVLVQGRREAFHRKVRKGAKHVEDDPARDPDVVLRGLRNRRLGRWLTAGYRNLDGVVFVIAGGGMLLGLFVAALFSGVFSPSSELAAGSWFAASSIESGSTLASQALLKPLVISAASIAVAFTLLGGLLSKYAPAIRAPLDVVLDVDNYFRDFPRSNICRARIFSRYAALLRHVRAQGYERIVIVAHSQGTVISAELLRFLSSDGRHAPGDSARPHLDGDRLPPISLLTLGCPLRQLYAARFPTLYRWVIARRGAISGPLAHDIGVERWANGFCSGDYVGRWLWSDSPKDDDPVGHPLADALGDASEQNLGRIDAYSEFIPMPPLEKMLKGRRELEVCLGLGAHTHYFEPDQSTVAWLVDLLLRPGPHESNAGPAVPAKTPPGAGRAAHMLAWGAVLGFALSVLPVTTLGWLRRKTRPGRNPS